MIAPAADALEKVLSGSTVATFVAGDLAELVVLQRCCWVQEALVNDTLDIPALHETHDEVLAWATEWTTLVVRIGGRLVAAVRGRTEAASWEVGRLMVAPDLAGRGIGSALLRLIENAAPPQVEKYTLFTGLRSHRNIRTYERAGYQLAELSSSSGPLSGVVHMVKIRR